MTGAFGFPIFVDLRGRSVFVAGGAREATAKATAMAELGAHVTVWAAEHRQAATLDATPGIRRVNGRFRPALLDGATLAIVATGDRALDGRIAASARARRVLVNTVDDVRNCDWSAPAILRRGELTIAIGTAGVAPALGVRLRDRLAGEIGPEYAALLELFGEVRPSILASTRSFADRRALWYDLVDGPALDLVREGRPDAARRAIADAIEAWEDQS